MNGTEIDPILQLRKLYGRLKGIERATVSAASSPGYIPASVARDYDQVLSQIESITGENLRSMSSHDVDHWQENDPSGGYYHVTGFASKLQQAIGLLEAGYSVNDKIVEIGSLYNSIKDEELRARCGDLLTATDHFDRVVNQATLVFEIRIRRKARLDATDIGSDLVNKAIKADPEKSPIRISDIRSEQEGFANICRGIMQALRNESHHRAAEFTREDAFAVCGFIDRLIRIIEQSSTR